MLPVLAIDLTNQTDLVEHNTGEDFFTIIDHLSRALQKESLSAVEARAYAAVTVSTLKEKRSDEYFERFWDKVTARAHQLGVEEPALPRKRRAPSRVDENARTNFYDETPKKFYQRNYFEIADKLTGEIERRFEAPQFVLYTKIEGLFKAAAAGHLPNNDTIQQIGDHFGDDLQGEELRVELFLLKNSFQVMRFTMKNLKDQLLRYQHF